MQALNTTRDTSSNSLKQYISIHDHNLFCIFRDNIFRKCKEEWMKGCRVKLRKQDLLLLHCMLITF